MKINKTTTTTENTKQNKRNEMIAGTCGRRNEFEVQYGKQKDSGRVSVCAVQYVSVRCIVCPGACVRVRV